MLAFRVSCIVIIGLRWILLLLFRLFNESHLFKLFWFFIHRCFRLLEKDIMTSKYKPSLTLVLDLHKELCSISKVLEEVALESFSCTLEPSHGVAEVSR